MTTSLYCPACQSRDIEPLFDMGLQPMSLVCLQRDPQESSLLEQHPIELWICHHCCHVHNAKFEPDLVTYNQAGCRMYNSGSGWQGHMEEVHGLLPHDVNIIVEIGAGDCEFLNSIKTGAKKLAIDPCEAVERAADFGIQYKRKFFDPSLDLPAGMGNTLVIMRHLLEHEEEPRLMLEAIVRRALLRHSKTWIYIETPNCENALKRHRIEDWTYEHPQHFTTKSMKSLFHNCGLNRFAILPKYGGEVLCCVIQIDPDEVMKDTINVPRTIQAYHNVAIAVERESEWMLDNLGDIAFWGGAGKSAMFLRKFKIPDDAWVVDSHEAKWRMCVPGTKIRMYSPDMLVSAQNRKIIIATTSWRAFDIRDEIIERDIPCERLLKFENGKLVEVPLGRN